MTEGSRIAVCKYKPSEALSRRQDKGSRRGRVPDGGEKTIFCSYISPREAFEIRFSEHQVVEYRGVKLWDFEVTGFFSRQRRGGLHIHSSSGAGDDMKYFPRGEAGIALRTKDIKRHNRDFLSREAYIIVNKVLPARESSARSANHDIGNVLLVQEELKMAFRNLGLL